MYTSKYVCRATLVKVLDCFYLEKRQAKDAATLRAPVTTARFPCGVVDRLAGCSRHTGGGGGKQASNDIGNESKFSLLTAAHAPDSVVVRVGVDEPDAARADEDLSGLGVPAKLVSDQGLHDLLGTSSPLRCWLRSVFGWWVHNCKKHTVFRDSLVYRDGHMKNTVVGESLV